HGGDLPPRRRGAALPQDAGPGGDGHAPRPADSACLEGRPHRAFRGSDPERPGLEYTNAVSLRRPERLPRLRRSADDPVAPGGPLPLMPATRTIPFARPWITDQERQAVLEVLQGDILTHGPQSHAFEEEFAHFVGGGAHCVTVSSCMAALHLAY